MPVAAVGVAAGVRLQKPEEEYPISGISLTVDFDKVLPEDGKWHDVGIQTRVFRTLPKPNKTLYMDYLSVTGGR